MRNSNTRRATRLAAGALIAIATGIAATAPAMTAQSNATLRAKVQRFVADFVRTSGVRGARPPRHSTKFVDLNGDGTPEALVVLQGALFCGARGCSAWVLDLRGTKARSIGDFTAATLDVLPSRTGRWRDISLNGVRMRYRNGRYRR